MIRLCKHNRRGMTMIEMTVAMAITALMVTCTMAMLLQTVRRCETELTQGSTDTDAVLAMQTMVSDIREAKTVTILAPGPASGAQLLVVKPTKVSATQGSYYDRSASDTTHPINFYLSDATHTVGRAGTYLWRSEVKDTGTVYRCIRKDMDPQGLVFETDVPKSVQITIRTKIAVSHEAAGQHQTTGKNIEREGIYTQLTDRVVYLRNY